MNTAETVSELFGNDGQNFAYPDGRDLFDICEAYGAKFEYGVPRYTDEDEQYVEPIEADRIGGITTDTLTRIVFPDGSAIVATFGAWDIEGEEPFSWAGA